MKSSRAMRMTVVAVSGAALLAGCGDTNDGFKGPKHSTEALRAQKGVSKSVTAKAFISKDPNAQHVTIQEFISSNALGEITISISSLTLGGVRDWVGKSDIALRIGLRDLQSGETVFFRKTKVGSFAASEDQKDAKKTKKFVGAEIENNLIKFGFDEVKDAFAAIDNRLTTKAVTYESDDLVLVFEVIEAEPFWMKDDKLIEISLELTELINYHQMELASTVPFKNEAGELTPRAISGMVDFKVIKPVVQSATSSGAPPALAPSKPNTAPAKLP